MSTIAIIQARTGSSRLPGKVLMPLDGKPDIHWVFSRMKQCVEVDTIMLATTVSSLDDELYEWALGENILCFRGSEQDVLKRYYDAAIVAGAVPGDIIVRITGDCPLIDPDICSDVIGLLKNSGADYVSNTNPPTFPDGLDCEAMLFETLERAHVEATLNYHREHVTQYVIKNPTLFNIVNLTNPEDLSHFRWTLDEPDDYDLLSHIFRTLDGDNMRMKDVLLFMDEHRSLQSLNASINRNEGLQKSIDEELLR